MFATPAVPVELAQQRRSTDDPFYRAEQEAQKQRERRANQMRQKSLQRDTAELLKLATELKDYVDKTNENTLSLSVIRKAEEIEKLAKNVKEKMKAEAYMPEVGKPQP